MDGMARPARYQADTLLDATRDLILEAGPRAAGIREIARRTGAPSGSLYHRFGSRDNIVAVAWIRAVRRFQSGFLKALSVDDPYDAVVGAIRWSAAFAASEPADTRLLLRFSRDDLMDHEPAQDVVAELANVNAALEVAVRRLAQRLFGNQGDESMERAKYAVIDLPYAVLRRHLLAGSLNGGVTSALEKAARAIVRDLWEVNG
jgi:AcrR family transcriptional regulator